MTRPLTNEVEETMSSPTDDRNDKKAEKQSYVKPDIQQVSLRPEEAVLGACKTTKVGGPGQGKCSSPSSCSALQS
jgi:hypothetical protein